MRSTVGSSKRRPMICTAVGSPAAVMPEGTDSAGHWPTMLNSPVMSRPSIRPSAFGRSKFRLRSLFGGAGRAMVGQIRAS